MTKNRTLTLLLIILILCVTALILTALRPGREVDFFGTVQTVQLDGDGNALITAALDIDASNVFLIKIPANARIRGLGEEEWSVRDIAEGDSLQADFKRVKDGDYYVAKRVLRLPHTA